MEVSVRARQARLLLVVTTPDRPQVSSGDYDLSGLSVELSGARNPPTTCTEPGLVGISLVDLSFH